MTVYVFRTSVKTNRAANLVGQNLDKCPGVIRWTFDLQDCDRVLRVEAAAETCPEKLCECLTEKGFLCEELV